MKRELVACIHHMYISTMRHNIAKYTAYWWKRDVFAESRGFRRMSISAPWAGKLLICLFRFAFDFQALAPRMWDCGQIMHDKFTVWMLARLYRLSESKVFTRTVSNRFTPILVSPTISIHKRMKERELRTKPNQTLTVL